MCGNGVAIAGTIIIMPHPLTEVPGKLDWIIAGWGVEALGAASGGTVAVRIGTGSMRVALAGISVFV